MGESDGTPANALPAEMVKSGQNPSENSMLGQAMSQPLVLAPEIAVLYYNYIKHYYNIRFAHKRISVSCTKH